MTLPRLEPDFVIDDLSLDWLRAKPGRKWRRFGTPYAAWIADMDFPPSPAIVALFTISVAGRSEPSRWTCSSTLGSRTNRAGPAIAVVSPADWRAARAEWRRR